ncbi:hypothetical protein ACMGDM_10455 [Sphingomonas sp. DT-51]|uniref:hypothetical protein n=1 Tax=Sphingomonas sp. DT-51 TaxID=3396165 RepID=UPI003F1AE407
MLRLLISILALLLALPASAAPACHEPVAARVATVAAPMHHHDHRPATPTAVMHDCLGCIPPANLAPFVVAARLRPLERQRPPMRASSTAGAALKPLSPPPRAV